MAGYFYHRGAGGFSQRIRKFNGVVAMGCTHY
jgi:hypothetical protein